MNLIMLNIEFSGDIILEVEPKMAKEIIKDWKDKKMLRRL